MKAHRIIGSALARRACIGVAHRTEKDRYDCLFEDAVYPGSKISNGPAGPGDA
jgi:hypothetical protein